MTPNSAKKTLLLSMLLSGVLLTVSSLRDGELPQPRRYIGLGSAYFMAAILLEIAPPVGAGMALLIAVTMLLKHGDRALAGVTGAQGYRSTASRGSVVPDYPLYRRQVQRTSGAWNGAKAAVQDVSRVAKEEGLRATGKRTAKYTVDDNISDHSTICRACYAEDLWGTVSQMDAGAVAIARELGVSYRKGQPLVATVNRNGFRIQVLYRTQIGGDHDDHIHVGARLLTYDPSLEERRN